MADGSLMAWGELTYAKPLTEKQMEDYELKPADVYKRQVLLLLLLLCFLVSAVSSIFPTLGSGLANALSGTSYASEDTDLLGVDEDYTCLLYTSRCV